MGKLISKAIGFGGELSSVKFPSQRLLEDPFASSYGVSIKEPPYHLEQLVFLAESHPTHAAALEQKVYDVISNGVKWVPIEEGADEDQLLDLQVWWESLTDEASTTELLQAMWNDYETVGWGAWELSRDPSGIVRQIYHVPGHTLRAHRDGELFVQLRDARRAWFKKWGVTRDFMASTGHPIKPDSAPQAYDKIAHELLMFRKLSRRSSWYGIPTYISSVGHITLSLAARDYNVMFFQNAREPRHLIVVTGLDEDVETALETLESALKTQMKDPHRNILLPLAGEAKVEIKSMALPQNDMHFSKLMTEMDQRILISHRMPSDRVGVIAGSGRGMLGNATSALNTIYKEGVVRRGQAVLEERLNRFVQIEYGRKIGAPVQWRATLESLDVTDEQADVNVAVSLVTADVLTLNEARERIGKPRLEALADMTWDEYRTKIGASGGGQNAPGGDQQQEQKSMAAQERLENVLGNLEAALEELMEAEVPDASLLPTPTLPE